MQDDYFHLFKQPVPIAYDTFLSLEATVIKDNDGKDPNNYKIRMVMDPVVIMWNPLDVPISIPADLGSFDQVLESAPFTVEIKTSGGTAATDKTYNCHLHGTLSECDHNYMSLDLNGNGCASGIPAR